MNRASRLMLLFALAPILAPHLWRMPVWLGLIGLLLFAWRAAIDWRGLPLPGKWLRTALTLLAFGAVLITYKSIAGRDPGAALLTLMLCLKLLEMRSLRDASLVIYIGYFLVAVGLLFSQSIATGMALFLVIFLLTAALMALHQPDTELRDYRRHLRLSGGLLLQSLPIMLVLFLLFPRIPGPLWGMPNEGLSGLTGISDTLFMGGITELADSEAIAFRAQFDGEPPPPGKLYWRGPVLWHTDGQLWKPLDATQLRGLRPLAPYEAEGEAVDYTITLEPHGRRWLFALDLPARPRESISVGHRATPDYQLHSERFVNERIRYRMRSYTDYDTGLISLWEARLGTQLPPNANPRTRALVKQWHGLSDTQVVSRALAMFREQPFYYTRTPPALERNPVDEFLFETRQGFCEHYAAAFVTLMRAAGIPARIVTGYQGGSLNEVDGFLLVRQSDAHAWAEVWLDESGWTRVDPTAAIPPERVLYTPDQNRFDSVIDREMIAGQWLAETLLGLRQNWDAINNAWHQWVLGFDDRRQRQLFERLGLDGLPWLKIILIMIGAIAALLLAIALYLSLGRARADDPLQRLWLRFCRRMEKAAPPRRIDEGPMDYAERLAAAVPERAEAIRAIAGEYARQRYAEGGGERDTLRRMIRELR